ncbi:ankyrin repeat domain-containing protein [Fulvivirga ulvae]|uniref:ankyrin repeat domain-containing protein n=1 Tax=Fulvivirga ulvae TaxID=2904245 RepID=UPI001F48B6F2|nr:ankyrin repeat domain-containing protein [Fulvivirga ulvae]UII32758.1 ankyrin repeat domain-containing protein [Fulvivirga ulvae]
MKNLTIKGLIAAVTIIWAAACNGTSQEMKSTGENVAAEAPKMSIHEAVFMGNVNAVQKHVAAGTDLDQKDQWGSTPLTIAATFDRTEAGLTLINGGADLNLQNREGSTPLQVAAFFGRTELAAALLKAGADKEIKNNQGSTALEVVTIPFDTLKPIYDQIGKDLGPFGLKLDYDRLQAERPKIASLLKK